MNRPSFRKSIALLLQAVMLAGLFAACGKTGENAEDPLPSAPEKVEVIVPSATVFAPQQDPEISLRITEVMFSNKTVIQDHDGDFSDWIELENTGSAPCSPKGFWLSDNERNLKKWEFPDVTVLPGERLLVFCSGKDVKEGELHTGFSLNKDSESLYFSYPSGTLFQAVIPEQKMTDNLSLCLGEGDAYTTYDATPGFPNSDEGRLVFLAQDDRHGGLVFNEICPFNEHYHFAMGGYYDWIELQNLSGQTLDLSNYYLTDDPNDPVKYPLPAETLAPGEYYMIFCSGERNLSRFAFCSFMFSLGAAGDELFLFNSQGNMIDKAGLYGIPLRGSMGRLPGEPGYFLFTKPTPEKDNINGYRFQSFAPKASVPEGLCRDKDSITVELTGKGQIYYTTDGSIPTAASTPYTGPLTFSETTPLRAVCIEDGKLASKPLTCSYILHENTALPVVSLVCNQRDFRSVYGLYSDRSRYADTTVSYFGEDGSFSADCSLTLHGASARRLLQKKHFKLTFKDRYGGDVDFNLFGEENFTGMHSFTLRGGGTQDMHIVRDSLTALVANDVSPIDPYTLDSRYCILYVNGQYWGLYAMREAYSGRYMQNHAGIDKDAALICRAPELGGDSKEFFELVHYITGHDMGKKDADDAADAEYFGYVSERMDLKSLAVWMCLEAYFNNSDPTGNVRYVKDMATPGAKWQFMFFDLDNSLGNPSGHWNIILNPASQIGSICFFMIKSPRFQTVLLETAAELMENGLSDEHCLDVFHSMIDEISPEVSRDMERWGEHEKQYEVSVEHMENVFSHGRLKTWLDGLQDALKASDERMHSYFPDYF